MLASTRACISEPLPGDVSLCRSEPAPGQLHWFGPRNSSRGRGQRGELTGSRLAGVERGVMEGGRW